MRTLTKFLTLYLLIKFSRSLQYIPENKIIEASARGEYTFGLHEEFEDELIARCYFEADTGEQVVFDIQPPSRGAFHQEEFSNIITTLGHLGQCQINVRNVNEKGPNKWTLTPAYLEHNNEKNGTAIEFTVKFFYYCNILNTNVTVLNEKSFFNHLIPPNGVTFESCQLKVKDTLMPLKMQGSKLRDSKDVDITGNIAALGRGLCGLIYTKAIYEEVNYLMWTLTAKDTTGKFYRNEFLLKVSNDFGFYDQTKSVVLGMPYTVQCGMQFTEQYCTLYNPQNEIVPEGCLYIINSFAFEHLGTWRCFSGNADSFDTIEYTITYVPTNELTVVPIMEETSSSVRIGCKINNYGMGSLTRCTLIAPNNRPYNIKYGGANERYLTLGTDYNNAICVIEIKKPLLDTENGYWKCEIIGPNRHKFGGTYIKVGDAKLPAYRKHSKLVTELNKTVTIHCEVPYTTDYCFIISPNGTRYSNEKKTHINLGQCSFTIHNAYPSDNGTWTCTYARKTGIPNDNILVELLVSDVLQSYQNIEVDAGNNAQLLCHTGGLPLAYCQFTAPNGTIFHVKKEESSTNLRYYGRGLERGDCGISLISAQFQDKGIWRCAVTLVRDVNSPEISANILLTVVPVADINIASVGIGVAVAVLVLATGVGYLIFVKRRQKHHEEIHIQSHQQFELQGDTISNSSSNL